MTGVTFSPLRVPHGTAFYAPALAGAGSRSDAAALRRPAAVVRDRRHVADRRDDEPDGLQCTQRGLATGTRALHLDLERTDTVFHRLAAGVLGGHLGGVRRRLARALEALRA